MTEQEKIDELVAMLDTFVVNGGGHMNVLANEFDEEIDLLDEEVHVEIYQSNDCLLYTSDAADEEFAV